MKKFKRLLKRHALQSVVVLVFGAAIGAALLYKLGSLTSGLSIDEIQLINSSDSWREILHNPLDAPLKALLWLASLLPFHDSFSLRIPSVLLGATSLLIFVWIVRRWYGSRTALFGVAFFGLSSPFLHASRLTTVEVEYIFATVLLGWLLVRLNYKPGSLLNLIMLPVILGSLLYTPGLVWLVILALILQRHNLIEHFGSFSKWQGIGLTVPVFLAVTAPLAAALWQNTALIKPWLGLPGNFKPILSMLQNLADTFGSLFFYGNNNPSLGIIGLSVLNAFGSVMFIAGLYFYGKNWRASRSQLLFAMLIAGLLLIAIGGPVAMGVIIPAIYLIALAGLGYLLHEWFKVFPHNPFARSTAILLITITLGLACFYNVRQYFIAWPHNYQTQAAFSEKL